MPRTLKVVTIPPPPATPRSDVVDNVRGERITDPYRWLEVDRSDRVKDWTDRQNARTRAALDRLPERRFLAARLRELLSVGLLSTPRPIAGRIFHTRREGEQKQAVLYVRDGVSDPDRALVDPNALDPAGLTTLDWYYPSQDARYVAYGLSHGGDELSTLRVIEVATGRDAGERISHTQRSTVAWVEGGFYYSFHPAPGAVPAGDENYHRRVAFHRLGADPARDLVVFGEDRAKEDINTVVVSPDGRWVLFSAWIGWVRTDVYLHDREHPERGLVPGMDAWETVIAEGEHVIEGFDTTRERLAVLRLAGATSRLATYDRTGREQREIALPSLGAIELVQGDADADLVGYTFQTFTQPPIAFIANVRTGESTELVGLRAPDGLDPSRITVEQTTYRSHDRTEVTMFLVHRSDVRPTGDVPTLLTGYGGFNVSRTPLYSAGAAAWVESGGLFALPNRRGGGEYGERWHRAGMLGNKQNVFEDFHSSGDALIANGWTEARRLAISGGSNGGLLVGAALTQRPELFAAVVCAVPLLDMLRYQNFRIARFWIPEYGSAEDPEQMRWLRAYSPYHNVRPGTRYPPVLFTTAEGDTRVDPMHARKMAALLQAQEDPNAIVLLRVDRDAGHGIGKPLDKQVEDFADQYAFLASLTGLAVNETAMLARR